MILRYIYNIKYIIGAHHCIYIYIYCSQIYNFKYDIKEICLIKNSYYKFL